MGLDLCGLWMAAIIVLVPGLVSYVAMPALGALLVVAGASSVKPREVRSLLDAVAVNARRRDHLRGDAVPSYPGGGRPRSRALGPALPGSIVRRGGRRRAGAASRRQYRGTQAPRQLPSITVLDVYGDLYYAAARTMERQLPSARGAEHPVVVLRLRGRRLLGATLMDVLGTYAKELHAAKGRLYLTGLSKEAHGHVARSGKLELTGTVRAHEATAIVWQSTREAVADAKEFISRATRGQT